VILVHVAGQIEVELILTPLLQKNRRAKCVNQARKFSSSC